MSTRILLAMIALSFSLSSCDSLSPEAQQQLFAREKEIEKLNYMKGHGSKPEELAEELSPIVELINRTMCIQPDLLDEVQVNRLDLLAQAVNVGEFEISESDYGQIECLAIKALREGTTHTRIIAASVLGTIQSEPAINELSEIVRTGTSKAFRNSVISLALMCENHVDFSGLAGKTEASKKDKEWMVQVYLEKSSLRTAYCSQYIAGPFYAFYYPGKK